jgi:exodeoxyribonuclease-5
VGYYRISSTWAVSFCHQKGNRVEWNRQQEDALRKVSEWLRDPNGKQIFRLFGFAGTGKTTLAKHLVESLNDVFFAAYTGKAALVLRQKGCPGASTLHSLMYNVRGTKGSEANLAHLREILKHEESSDIPDREKIRSLVRAITEEESQVSQPNFSLNLNSPLNWADLLVVDEASMVGKRMGGDMTQFSCRILALGDPFQLPPVRDKSFFDNVKPDVMLTDVERQAKENPVLHLATKVRNHEGVRLGTYGDSRVITKAELKDRGSDALTADQILVGRNETRHQVNGRVRQMKGLLSEIPVVGDKLVCIRNNHQYELLNGSLWDVVSEPVDIGEFVQLDLRPSHSRDSFTTVLAWKDPFLGKPVEGSWYEKMDAEEFEFGWGMTVHKSQGSQWDSVLLIDESNSFGNDADRHLYTGLTRAAQKITVAI